MATQVSLNDGAVASAGALAIQTNGTTQAVSISTGQVATLAQNPILTSGTANGVAYLNGSKVLTTGSALVFDGTNLGVGQASPSFKIDAQVAVGGAIAVRPSTSTGNAKQSALRLYGSDSVTASRYAEVACFNDTAGSDTNALTFSTGYGATIFERARIPSAGGIQSVGSISVGNATPTTSGAGITFPATQSASTDANTLDDYEEGTFTPTAVGSTTAGTGTYGTQTGVYTKIGRFVHAYIGIDWSAHTGTGNLRISGLPFSATQNEVANMFANGLTYTGTHLQPFLVGTEVWLVQTSSGAADTYIPMDTNCQLGFTIVYYV